MTPNDAVFILFPITSNYKSLQESLLTFRITDTVSCKPSRAASPRTQAGEGWESRAVISCIIIFQNKMCNLHLFGTERCHWGRCHYLPSLHWHYGADKGRQTPQDPLEDGLFPTSPNSCIYVLVLGEDGVLRRGRKVADIRTSWEKELLSPGIQSGAVMIIVC